MSSNDNEITERKKSVEVLLRVPELSCQIPKVQFQSKNTT